MYAEFISLELKLMPLGVKVCLGKIYWGLEFLLKTVLHLCNRQLMLYLPIALLPVIARYHSLLFSHISRPAPFSILPQN